ncbi:gamma-type small acid-soluble spore protein [Sporosarcina sp. NPDC096371]|uniref:gamma-type small acid-soluble spore protein n=1 Tax=Sporosarcina sp. NPDC096371 TaxID=3364530 RepID=UPI003815CBBC
MTNNNQKKFTEAGTDIMEVKRQNANSGLTYNEVKAILAKRGREGTTAYSDTNVEEERK